MKSLITLLTIMLCGTVDAEPYFNIGAGVMDSGKPEVNLGHDGGIVKAGWRFKYTEIEYIHITGLKKKEKGYGVNGIFYTVDLFKVFK